MAHPTYYVVMPSSGVESKLLYMNHLGCIKPMFC